LPDGLHDPGRLLTASSFVPFGKEEEGDFSGGAVIKW
jgi:hypothetical protein